MSENRAVWKSNNQGVKEETFTQTCRGGRNGQPGWRELPAKWQLAELWSLICMQINQEEQLGIEINHTTQSSSTRK